MRVSIDSRSFLSSKFNDQPPSYYWLNLGIIAPKIAPSVFLNHTTPVKQIKTDPELSVLVQPYDELLFSLQADGCALIWGITVRSYFPC
jgi:hypothetical protein